MSGASPPPSTSGVSGLPPPPEDAERDAWLHAALRHAPDAGAAPPESLRRSILNDARAAAFANARATRQESTTPPATAARRPNVALDTIASLWASLARPPVAAAFASVMAATLVGVMWWDRPLDEALPSATPPVAALRDSATLAERSTAPAPSVPALAAEHAAAPKEDKRAFAKAERPPVAKPRTDSRSTPTENTAAASLDGARAPDTAATVAAAAQPFPAATPAGALAKASPAPAAPPNEATKTARPSANAIDDALGRSGPPSVPAMTAAPAFAAAPRLEARYRQAPASVASAASGPVMHPLADVLGALAADPTRWSVLNARGERTVVDEAFRAWLARADAGGEWRPLRSTDETAPGAADAAELKEAPIEAATVLTLLHNGRIDTVVRIGAGRIVVERRDGAGRGASALVLVAPAAAALANSLPAGLR